MKYIFTGGVTVLIFFCLALVSCYGQNVDWKAPAWADTLKKPFKVNKAVLNEGKLLYTTYCMSCHGKTGNGDGAPGMTFAKKPANFHDADVIRQSDGALFWKLTHGRGGMPAYGTALSEKQRWQIVAYIRDFSNTHKLPTAGKLQNTIAAKGYSIDRSISQDYFPLPRKVSNAVKSETVVFMVDTVVSGLKMPWSFIFLPDKSALIAERAGGLLRVRNGKVQARRIAGEVPPEIRDIKLHPQFEKNRLIYMSYYIEPVKPDGGYTVLMRAKLEGDSLVNKQVLYKAGPFREGGFWYGSKIVFDSKGYLYFAVGQRTIDGRHRWKTVQDKGVSSGKIMRLNDDGSVPKDNPFVDSARALPEIYTYGHRQPEGLVYDPHTGQVWENEHGEMGGCELNILQKGGNYGWPEVTFSLNYDGTIISKDTTRAGMVSPVHYWIPSLAPGGMDFVYGSKYPGWNGNLFISSLVQKMVNRSVVKNNRVVHDEKLLQGIGRVRDIKFGPDQLLYVMTEDTGLILRLLPLKKNN